MQVLNYIRTNSSIIIVVKDGDPITILDTNDNYDRVCELLERGNFSEAINLSKTTREGDLSSRISVSGDTVYIDGENLPAAINERFIYFINNRISTTVLENFWDNLKKNVSTASIRDLYAFIEHNNMTVTPDGHFIAYKKVIRQDGVLVDCRTKTIINDIGSVVKMDRGLVNPDNEQTCSSGLHVASWNYAYHFQQGVMVRVKVNPMDVVAVPKDYNNQKMRVCRYEVIEIVENDSDKIEDPDVYIDSDLMDDPDFADDDIFDGHLIKPTVDNRLNLPSELLREAGICFGDTVYLSLRSLSRSEVAYLKTEEPENCDISNSYLVGGDENSPRVRISTCVFDSSDYLKNDGENCLYMAYLSSEGIIAIIRTQKACVFY